MKHRVHQLEKRMKNTGKKTVLMVWDADQVTVNGSVMSHVDAEAYRRRIEALYTNPVIIDVQADGFGAI